LRRANFELVHKCPYDKSARELGLDWPERAETMVGLRRLTSLQECVEAILRENIRGDFIETGVWRGGSVIFMRAVLAAWQDTSRTVWAVDSFAGLPPPDTAHYPADRGDRHHLRDELAVDLATVRRNVDRYGFLDDRTKFLVGWFKDTLPRAPVDHLALIRLDGDMYGSTFEALESLYHRLSPGGFVIVDDYLSTPGCRRAVDDFRLQSGIELPLETIDRSAVYWRAGR
jgi:O-methyltransferase